MVFRVDSADRSLRLSSRRWKHTKFFIPFLCILVITVGVFVKASKRTNRDSIRSSDPCWQMVDRVKRARIQLIAFDFDATIIDVHTGGRWKGSAEELAKHVRPDMLCVIERCLESEILVSVATFSTQTRLISQVLTLTIGNFQAKAIPVFGDQDRFEKYDQGKQSQLLLSINHYNQMHNQRGKPITPSSTLLVDDDADNIQVAKADGYNILLYQPGSQIDAMEIAKPLSVVNN